MPAPEVPARRQFQRLNSRVLWRVRLRRDTRNSVSRFFASTNWIRRRRHYRLARVDPGGQDGGVAPVAHFLSLGPSHILWYARSLELIQ